MNAVISKMLCERRNKALPILSFPSVKPLGVSVGELCTSSELQAEGMRIVAERCDTMASVSYMDLSVEAECFGAQILFSDNEVPCVIGKLINTADDVAALHIPQVGTARSGIYVEAIRRAKVQISDRAVLAGMIGPLSLAARLFDVTDLMMACFDDPAMVCDTLDKATDFLIAYGRAFKEAGADGVVVAEPVAGLFDPYSCDEFSSKYVKRMVEALQDDGFAVIYHNCGGSVTSCIDSILSTGCAAYHFGNAIDIKEILAVAPDDTVIMGNIDPVGVLKDGAPETVYQRTYSLMSECTAHKGFVISTGCDVPPEAPWENIDAFFRAVRDFYENIRA